MTSRELAEKLHLNPRAVVFTGSLRERTKNSITGAISGFTPHYASKGCVPVAYHENGQPEPSQNEGAAIEADFAEASNIMPGMAESYGRPLNMIHLIFGNQARSPNIEEYKVLLEAGTIAKASMGKSIHAVAIPVLSSGQYGVAQGRLYLLGLFDNDGSPLWVHPNAISSKVLVSEFGPNQKVRSTQESLTPPVHAPAPAPAQPSWYEVSKQTLAAVTKLSGAKLHEKTLQVRADQLAKDQGLKPKDALALAHRQYSELVAATPPATQPATQTPKLPDPSSQGPSSAQKRLSKAKV